jgi:hypothetical protein
MSVPSQQPRLEGRADMTLKITINETPETVKLRLEGRVARPWLSEFQSAWDGLAVSIGSRKLTIDLCGVTQMCPDARKLLAEIHTRTGARFLADTPLTKYFAEEAQNSKHARKHETGEREK